MIALFPQEEAKIILGAFKWNISGISILKVPESLNIHKMSGDAGLFCLESRL